MSTEPIPQDLVAVHDLLRKRLPPLEIAAAAWATGSPFSPGRTIWRAGFRHRDERRESTVLTYRMRQPLVEVPVYVSGRIPATVRRV